MKTQQKVMLASLSMALFLLFGASQGVSGAAGTAGYVEFGTDTYVSDSLVTVRCWGLTEDADFTITFTAGGPSNITFSTVTGQTTFTMTMVLSGPTTGSEMKATLTGGTNTGSTLDVASIVSQEVEDLLPRTLLITMGIGVAVILIIAAIVKKLK